MEQYERCGILVTSDTGDARFKKLLDYPVARLFIIFEIGVTGVTRPVRAPENPQHVSTHFICKNLMAQAATNGAHGPKWLAEMRRLKQAAACGWGAKSLRAMKNCGLASRKVAMECILNCAGKLKMEIPDNTRNSRVGCSMR